MTTHNFVTIKLAETIYSGNAIPMINVRFDSEANGIEEIGNFPLPGMTVELERDGKHLDVLGVWQGKRRGLVRLDGDESGDLDGFLRSVDGAGVFGFRLMAETITPEQKRLVITRTVWVETVRNRIYADTGIRALPAAEFAEQEEEIKRNAKTLRPLHEVAQEMNNNPECEDIYQPDAGMLN